MEDAQDQVPNGKRSRAHHTLSTADRDAEVARMRAEKFSFTQIGAALGISRQSAQVGYQRAQMAVPVESITTLRRIENAKLDKIETALLDTIDNPGYIVAPNGTLTEQPNVDARTRASDTYIRCITARAKLNGLNFPVPTIRITKNARIRYIKDLADQLGIEYDDQPQTIPGQTLNNPDDE